MGMTQSWLLEVGSLVGCVVSSGGSTAVLQVACCFWLPGGPCCLSPKGSMLLVRHAFSFHLLRQVLV